MGKWLLVLSLLVVRPAFAGDGLDVKDWLSRPGVKLLAVEFYASWCGPCKKAVPQWKALHEKYRDQGLRLVVVSVQDPDGACVNPGWNPDDVVCDSEGRLAEAWGVGDKLPAAFLWSWRGPLLVRKGHVDELKQALDDELGRLPRVTLDEGMDGQVRELLRTELARTGKVDVVAGQEEDAALAEIRKRSGQLQFSERSACKLGQRLAANSLLKASFVKAGSGKRLLVQLFSAETGCLNGSAGVFWNEGRPELSVAEAVAELVNNLRVAPELPGGTTPSTVREREIGEQEEGWELEGTSGVIVAFETEPPASVVLLDGKMLCPATPCSRLVAPGSHKLEFHMESHLPIRESISVNDRTGSVKRTLTPDFGWLTVRSQPAGVGVMLDGKPWGVTPVERRQVSSGPHRVLVSAPQYFDKGREFVVDRGEHENVVVELSPRQGGIQVQARDRLGNDIKATVTVDGIDVGMTPFSGKVTIGRHRVRVLLEKASWDRSVTVLEKKTERLVAELDVAEPPPGRTASTLSVASVEPAKSRDGKRLFHLGVSLSEGVGVVGGEVFRSNVGLRIGTWLKWSWFRWEPLHAGVALESPNAWMLGSGAAFDVLGGFYLRAALESLLDSGSAYWGVQGGAGHAFDLGSGWRIDAEVDATLWPGDVSAVPVEARLGVRYGF